MNISKIITNSLNESLKVNKDSVIDDNFFQQLEIASSF